MRRQSERIKQSQADMRIKMRAKKRTHTVIESSQSDNTKDTQTEDVPLVDVFPEKGEKSTADMGEPSNVQREGDQTTEKATGDDKEKEEIDEAEKTISEVLRDLSNKKRKSGSISKLLAKRSKTTNQEEAGTSKKAKITSPEGAGASKKKKKVSDLEKSKSQGNPSKIPRNWFVDKGTIPEWSEKFKDRTLAYCSLIQPELLEILNTKALEHLKKSQFRKLFNRGSLAYPRLTRLFYFNLSSEIVDGKQVIRSLVAGIPIEITQKVITKALGIKVSDSELPDRKTCVEGAKRLFLVSEGEPGKQLTNAKLNCEGKLLFNILVRCIVPKASSREMVTDRMLELMFLIHEGYDLNAPSFIMDHMVNCSTKGRNSSLPYGNILPLIFEHFKIPVENEEKITKGFETLNEQSFGKMGLCFTKSGVWKSFIDLSAEEKDEKEFVKPRTTIPSTTAASTSVGNTDQIMEKLNLLENSVGELKDEVKKLGQGMNGFKEQMENLGKLLGELITKETAEDSDEEEPAEDSESNGDPKGDDKEREISAQGTEEDEDNSMEEMDSEEKKKNF